MTDTFYRLHSNPDAPTFSADNAYSGLWGSTWTADGSQTECHGCGGSGHTYGMPDEECDACDGTGWEDAQHGYSCCWSAQELVDYVTEHGAVEDGDQVVVFGGRQVGTGFDGEPLAVPTGDVRWMTWGQLVELARTEAVAQ